MGTDIATRDSGIQPATINDVKTLAEMLCSTEFVPTDLRNSAPKVFAAILYGRELGIPTMQALAQIAVIKGRPSLSAEAMRSLILSAGHQIKLVHSDTEKCVIKGRRVEDRDDSDAWQAFTFTLKDATTARLAGSTTWTAYPADMLLARATTRMARAMFADVIHGLTSIEEATDTTDTPPATIIAAQITPMTATIPTVSGSPEEITDTVAAPVAPPKRPNRAHIPRTTTPPTLAPVDNESPSNIPSATFEDTILAPGDEPHTPHQRRHLEALVTDLSLKRDGVGSLHGLASAILRYKVTTTTNLTAQEMQQIIDYLMLAKNLSGKWPPIPPQPPKATQEQVSELLNLYGTAEQANQIATQTLGRLILGVRGLTVEEAQRVIDLPRQERKS